MVRGHGQMRGRSHQPQCHQLHSTPRTRGNISRRTIDSRFGLRRRLTAGAARPYSGGGAAAERDVSLRVAAGTIGPPPH